MPEQTPKFARPEMFVMTVSHEGTGPTKSPVEIAAGVGEVAGVFKAGRASAMSNIPQPGRLDEECR